MAYKSSCELHHNFAKLADESGFTFHLHKPRGRLDWNKIRSIDIDKLVRDRNFTIIEDHVNDVLDCVLESEFDTRILDEGVVKLFRLAQLTIEYQQFCRQHLDRSVILLREELMSLMQEVERRRKDLRNKDDNIKKLRRKTKYMNKTSNLYGNENIAEMILKTLSNNVESSPYTQHYNKCKYCDKVFLNQLYLKGHVLRRHKSENDKETVTGIVKENSEQFNPHSEENTKLYNEIEELRSKLQDMELKFERNKCDKETETLDMNPQKETNAEKYITETQQLMNEQKTVPYVINESYDNITQQSIENQKILIEKIDKWKQEEHDKYKSEINLLKEQIMDNLKTITDKEADTSRHNEMELITELRNTIRNQNSEISSLKEDLKKVLQTIQEHRKRDREENRRAVEEPRARLIDAAQQYDKSFDTISNIQKGIHRKMIDVSTYTDLSKPIVPIRQKESDALFERKKDLSNNESFIKQNQRALEELQRKTQELLNIDSSIESSISDDSDLPTNIATKSSDKSPIKHKYRSKADGYSLKNKNNNYVQENVINSATNQKLETTKEQRNIKNVSVKKNITNIKKKSSHNKGTPKKSKNENQSNQTSSPTKILRAKITEAVHKRLIATGVDPLKTGLGNDVFHSQCSRLRQQEEVKKKRDPSYEKVRHSILAFLDYEAAEETVKTITNDKNLSQGNIRNFRFASVFSNVKNKALSLIKPTEKANNRSERKITRNNILEKTESIFKTSISSDNVSPIKQRRVSSDSNHSYTLRTVSQKFNDATPIRKYETQLPSSNPKTRSVKAEITKPEHSYTYDETDSECSSDEINTEENKNQHDLDDLSSFNNTLHNILPSNKKSVYVKSNSNRPSPNKKPIEETIQSTINNQYTIHRPLENKTEIPQFSMVEDFVDDIQNSDDSVSTHETKKMVSDENIFTSNNTKSALKHAPSISSLAKKKVIFDLDANQIKSVSASPSQSTTEKSEADIPNTVVHTLDLEEEWDISSIGSSPVKSSRKANLISSRTTPKIAELSQRIQSQLARRGNVKPPGVGSVDLLRVSATGGSNTSLGSSVLDEPDAPTVMVKDMC